MANIDDARGFQPRYMLNGDPIRVLPRTFIVKDSVAVRKFNPVQLTDQGTTTRALEATAASDQLIGIAVNNVSTTDTDRTLRVYPVSPSTVFAVQLADAGTTFASQHIGSQADFDTVSGTTKVTPYGGTEAYGTTELLATFNQDTTKANCLIIGLDTDPSWDPDNTFGDHAKVLVTFNQGLLSGNTNPIDAV
ncbi:MAG: hypothetical protein ABIH23_08535 [bacterium]